MICLLYINSTLAILDARLIMRTPDNGKACFPSKLCKRAETKCMLPISFEKHFNNVHTVSASNSSTSSNDDASTTAGFNANISLFCLFGLCCDGFEYKFRSYTERIIHTSQRRALTPPVESETELRAALTLA